MRKIIIAISVLSLPTFAGRPLMSGDIVGRDLDIPVVGKLGHVGMGTGDDVGFPTQLIIEVLNEAPRPVIQFNSLSDFHSRSKYWGSRYGIGDYNTGTYNALVEGHHQSWWCPSYTYTAQYFPGAGDIRTRIPKVCAKFRCDTFVSYIFYSAGFPQLLRMPQFPNNIWSAFPYSNDDAIAAQTKTPELSNVDKNFISLTADEINNMGFQEFSSIADTPFEQTTPTHWAMEFEYAQNEAINDIKRGVFIDRLSMSNQKNVITKLFDIYSKTNNIEIKTKVIECLQTHYQTHPELISDDEESQLIAFYDDQIHKDLRDIDKHYIVRGVVQNNSAEIVLTNSDIIINKLSNVEPRLKLGLQLMIADKSPQLESIFIPLIIKDLKVRKDSYLDDMFFGIISASDSLFPQSKPMIYEYISACADKYNKTLAPNNDLYFNMAKKNYQNVVEKFIDN